MRFDWPVLFLVLKKWNWTGFYCIVGSEKWEWICSRMRYIKATLSFVEDEGCCGLGPTCWFVRSSDLCDLACMGVSNFESSERPECGRNYHSAFCDWKFLKTSGLCIQRNTLPPYVRTYIEWREADHFVPQIQHRSSSLSRVCNTNTFLQPSSTPSRLFVYLKRRKADRGTGAHLSLRQWIPLLDLCLRWSRQSIFSPLVGRSPEVL